MGIIFRKMVGRRIAIALVIHSLDGFLSHSLSVRLIPPYRCTELNWKDGRLEEDVNGDSVANVFDLVFVANQF